MMETQQVEQATIKPRHIIATPHHQMTKPHHIVIYDKTPKYQDQKKTSRPKE